MSEFYKKTAQRLRTLLELNKTFPSLYRKIMKDMNRNTLYGLPTASDSCEEA